MKQLALKNHFLKEDYSMVLDELDKLHNEFSKIRKGVENANYSMKEQQLENVNHSLNILQSLHIKKRERERIDYYA